MAAQGRRRCWQNADKLAQCHSEVGRGLSLVRRYGHFACERTPRGTSGRQGLCSTSVVASCPPLAVLGLN
jgi:hypothetical protein